MRVTVSLPEKDVAFLDEYAKSAGTLSRSAVIQRAIQLLRLSELGKACSEAWEESCVSGDTEVWETTVGHGIED